MYCSTDSTHYKNWIFTPAKLQDERKLKSGKLKSKIIAMQDMEKSVQGNLMIISNESEMEVIRHYISSIRKFCQELPINIFSTASQYLLRFYLKRSIYFHNPVVMTYTSLNLAMKVEEFHIYPTEFINKCKSHCTKEELINYELELMQLLNFNLKVISPYDTIESLLKMDRKAGTIKTDEEAAKIKEIAYQFSDKAFLTDTYYLYMPSRIGYAAYKVAFPLCSYKPTESFEKEASEIAIMVGKTKIRDKSIFKEIVNSVRKFIIGHPMLKDVKEQEKLPIKRKSDMVCIPSKRMKE